MAAKKNGKAPAKTKTKAGTKTGGASNDVLIGVILDRSGSMESCRAATISGFNEFVNAQRKQTSGNRALMSLVQFDSAATPDIDINFVGTPLDKVPELTAASYVPRGMTPLYDAIVTSVRTFESWCATEKWTGRVLCVIVTDGHENASREATAETVRKLIAEKEASGWSFVYLGANQDAFGVGAAMGIAQGATANYTASHVGTASAFASVARNTSAYLRSSGRGAQASASFFASAGRPDLDVDDVQAASPLPSITSTTIAPNSGRLQPRGIAVNAPEPDDTATGRLTPQ